MPTKKKDTDTELPTSLKDKEGPAKPQMPSEHMRTARSFKHQCFKLHVGIFKRNDSWKYLEPSLHDVEHCHFFHSVDRSGKPNERCAPVGGHSHKITIHWDKPVVRKEFPMADGSVRIYEGPQFECGPPIHERRIRVGNSKRVIKKQVPVTFPAINSEGDQVNIPDNHTHFIEYIGTDIISEQTQRETQDRDRAMIAPLVNKTQVANQAMEMQRLAGSASTGASLTKG